MEGGKKESADHLGPIQQHPTWGDTITNQHLGSSTQFVMIISHEINMLHMIVLQLTISFNENK